MRYFLSFHANAQTYLNCDFTEGIPSSFTLIDNDGLQPSKSMTDYGFSVGVPWIVASPTGEKNLAACSTSWYSPSGQADDWLITPAITIADDGAVLSWRAMASDNKYRDGYAVYVSTNGGNTVADFDTSAPLFSVDEEESAWTAHVAALDAYKGQTISLAFVNNSNNKSRLYIDDIFAGVSAKAYLRSNLAPTTPLTGEIEVSGTAYTQGAEAINGFTVGLEYGGNSYTQHFDSTIEPGQETPFTLDAKIQIGWHETVDYTLWVEADGTRSYLQRTLTSYPRKVVCDDVTGTWCGYCVRGIVALESLRANHSDQAIGLAAHSGDVMSDGITSYVSHLASVVSWSGLPAGVVNRKLGCDPGNFATYIDQMISQESIGVAMKLQAQRDADSGEVTATTSLWFANDMQQANYRVAYVLVENRVHQPGNDKYKQHNSYAGGGNGEMGGFENKPEYVPSEEMYFDDVVRCTIGDFDGQEGSIPTSVKAEEEITHTVTFSLPETVLNAEETELVAMVIDQSDRHIVNAERIALGNGSLMGIETSTTASGATPTVTARYNLNGQKISSPQHGLNILRMSDGTTKKVIIK